MAEPVDALDSKSNGREIMGVQVSLRAPCLISDFTEVNGFRVFVYVIWVAKAFPLILKTHVLFC